MFQVSTDQFHELVNEAMSTLPKSHMASLKNVALIVEDFPSPAQRQQLELNEDQTLLGLYEGLPLSKRQGMTKTLPDKITLFQGPLESRASNINELREAIRHTLWHEIAHYYGLDHPAIKDLEK